MNVWLTVKEGRSLVLTWISIHIKGTLTLKYKEGLVLGVRWCALRCVVIKERGTIVC